MEVPKKSNMSNQLFEVCKRCATIDFVEAVLATMGLRWPQVALEAIPWLSGVSGPTPRGNFSK
jgi:hypothetical protein